MSQKEKDDQMLSLVRIAAQAERVVEAWESNKLASEVTELGALLAEHNKRFGEN